MSKRTRLVAAAFSALAFSAVFASAAFAVAPTYTMTVDKAAVPASLPAAGGSVTYWYTVTNTGTGDLQSVDLVDNKCTPITFDSSDNGTSPANPGDKLLGGGSHWWKFKCTTTLHATTTNTVNVVGCHSGSNCDQSGNHDAAATDSATVTVGTNTATVDMSGTSAGLLALILLAIGGFGFFASTGRLPKLR
jgi:hypothetical protein